MAPKVPTFGTKKKRPDSRVYLTIDYNCFENEWNALIEPAFTDNFDLYSGNVFDIFVIESKNSVTISFSLLPLKEG